MVGSGIRNGDDHTPGWQANARALAARAVGERHLWLTVAMMVLGVILHYTSPLPFAGENNPLQLTRHNMNRVLFMVPVVYAGFIFGPRGGYITLAVATLVMVPRALFISPSPADAMVEILSIILVSSLILLWFTGQQKEKERRLEVLSRLELARQELASQVEIIKKNERRLATLNEISSVVTQSLDLPDILQRILDEVVEEMGVEVALIFLRDGMSPTLALVAHKGVSEDFASAVATLKVGEGFNGRVAASGVPMVVENSLVDPRLYVPQVREEGLQSQLIVPLRSKGANTGTLCVAVRSSRRFSADDKDLLTAIGSQVGIAIENALLYQKALASEEKYRDLFKNATVAIFVHDLAGAVVAANNACTGLTGYPLEELLGTDVARLFPPHAREVLAEVQQDLLLGKDRAEPYDIQLVRSDGAESILSMTTRLVWENGQPQGLQHIAIDVTERRRMRDTLDYYVQQVLTAQEEERKRIARELHDETAQSLLLILQRMDSLSYSHTGRLAELVEQDMEQLRAIVLQTLGDLRRLTRDLRPQILDDLGLVAAVEWLAEDTERQCGIKTAVDVVGPQRRLAPEVQLLLFRIAQEALSNVRRHSGATEARAVMEFVADKVTIAIEDNGQGFVLPSNPRDLASAGKLGLLGMSERARLLGGSVTIHSEPGKGTRVVADVVA